MATPKHLKKLDTKLETRLWKLKLTGTRPREMSNMEQVEGF